jgi:AraC-like DNA-binding protein
LPQRVKDSEIFRDSVPVAFTRALLARAQAHGCDLDDILRQARFPFDPLRQGVQTALVSPRQYSRLCQAVFRGLRDESGGIMPDARTPPGTTRLILLSMLGSPTLAVALRRALEFNACCRVRGQASVRGGLLIDASGREATLTYTGAGDAAAGQHLVLCSIAMWLRLCGWLIGHNIDITAASCAGPEPDFKGAVRHFFPGPVHFRQRVNSATFSARHLQSAIIRDEAQLDDFLSLAPYHAVIEPPACAASISGRIRAIIGADFSRDLPGFEELTGLLSLSARTLRRRLECEGTSYQRIKDNARRDAAIALLSRDGLTVSEVAEQVGFSDPSAFHRSFKKWTGQSPGSYR